MTYLSLSDTEGASAIAPENTLAAFTRAIQDGAEGIEFDVRLSQDGVPVVIHDATLARTGLIDGAVAELSAEVLGRTGVGSWLHHTLASRRLTEQARKSRLEVVVWTVDNPEWIERARSRGVKALITNDPAIMLRDRNTRAAI